MFSWDHVLLFSYTCGPILGYARLFVPGWPSLTAVPVWDHLWPRRATFFPPYIEIQNYKQQRAEETAVLETRQDHEGHVEGFLESQWTSGNIKMAALPAEMERMVTGVTTHGPGGEVVGGGVGFDARGWRGLWVGCTGLVAGACCGGIVEVQPGTATQPE